MSKASYYWIKDDNKNSHIFFYLEKHMAKTMKVPDGGTSVAATAKWLRYSRKCSAAVLRALRGLDGAELLVLTEGDLQAAGLSVIKARAMHALLHEPLYLVEALLKCRTMGVKKEYLVKWDGYTHAHNTWEPSANLPTHLTAVFGECTAHGCVLQAMNHTRLCFKHGAYGFCRIPACTTVAKRRGVCFQHGAGLIK